MTVSAKKAAMINDAILKNAPEAQDAIGAMRKDFNMSGGKMNPKNLFYGLERVKCSEAEFFPNPPSFWQENAPLLYTLCRMTGETI